VNTKPFHESIIEIIDAARTGRELACLVNLVISSVIPANHDAIIQAFQSKRGKLRDDYLIEMLEQSLLSSAESHLLKEKERVTAKKKCLNEVPFEYTAKNGTLFTAKRSDFHPKVYEEPFPAPASDVKMQTRDGMRVYTSSTNIEKPLLFMKDVLEMLQYHVNHILPYLQSFSGYDKVCPSMAVTTNKSGSKGQEWTNN
jgi:hypothetical protein